MYLIILFNNYWNHVFETIRVGIYIDDGTFQLVSHLFHIGFKIEKTSPIYLSLMEILF